MQLKFLTPLTMGMLFSASVEASGEVQSSAEKAGVTQEEAKKILITLRKYMTIIKSLMIMNLAA